MVLVSAIVATVLGGAAALAADQLSTSDIAQSLPCGNGGTDRHRPDVHGREAGRRVPLRPGQAALPEVSDWKGTVESTVDATKHVNGGCRALQSDGLAWECYLGQAAVDQQIVGQGFLGQYAPEPGHG